MSAPVVSSTTTTTAARAPIVHNYAAYRDPVVSRPSAMEGLSYHDDTQRLPALILVIEAILSIFIPPVAVALHTGSLVETLLNILLTIVGWFPGIVHALIVVFTPLRLSCTSFGTISPPPSYIVADKMDKARMERHARAMASQNAAPTTTSYPSSSTVNAASTANTASTVNPATTVNPASTVNPATTSTTYPSTSYPLTNPLDPSPITIST